MGSKQKDIMQLDVYDLLEISINASLEEIKKAYRKKALKCHPDKNPDNPKAAEEFHLLYEILAILTDEAARGAYDKLYNARKANAARMQLLDEKRRRLREDLDRRELLAAQQSMEEALKKEVDRLRREASELLIREQKELAEQIRKERLNKLSTDQHQERYKLKVTWQMDVTDTSSNAESDLRKLFGQYGVVTDVVCRSKNKRGSALVEFSSLFDAKDPLCETGKLWKTGKLESAWISPPPVLNTSKIAPSCLQETVESEDAVLMKMIQLQRRLDAQKETNQS